MHTDLPLRNSSAPADVLADVASVGVALIDGVPGRSGLVALAHSIGTVVPHRDSDLDGATAIEDRAHRDAAMVGFTRAPLAPHTDRSSIENPPGLLLTVCSQEPVSGGESVIVDGQAVYDDLAQTMPSALAALCAPRSALFGGADGYLGSVFAPGPDGVVAVRLRLDSLVRFAPAVAPHIPALRAAIERHLVTLPVRTGAGYVLNNRRWLHGRRGFAGPRLMYRVTADPRPHTVTAGFRPETTVTGETAVPTVLRRQEPIDTTTTAEPAPLSSITAPGDHP
ncbi:TauD/TfdA family dioxygenase [Promicromonospora sp. NPDC060271]|uniref:TauD/TfdA family dioxygenase n=1 Tax=Promicromonospora sp. NPDC060271 TaxID=3347089 RepID=UPI00364E7FC9